MTKPRRWRMVKCFIAGIHEIPSKKEREEKANLFIKTMNELGFKTKIYAPLPEHQTSGHTHVTVLCNFEELCTIGGINESFKIMDVEGKSMIVKRDISQGELDNIISGLRETRGWVFSEEVIK